MAKLPRNVTKNSVRIPSAADLKQRFLPGSIPTAADFANLIDMANAAPHGFTPGMIVMFIGSVAELPDGWVFCDSSAAAAAAGAPNLEKRFLIGRQPGGPTESAATPLSGEGANLKLDVQTELATAEVSVTLGDTQLTEAQIPAHKHSMGVRFAPSPTGTVNPLEQSFAYGSYSSVGFGMTISNGHLLSVEPTNNKLMPMTGPIGSDEVQGHNHTVSVDTPQHQHALTIKPPYYALAFIMKLPYS
ncbi:hypothetical protein SFA35_18610 [Pseudomonas sp. HR96]|uniref:hypothetical protein n=1 Tax=Pseudomonas sp. HR96 TaxID=1027966 RepID=UPI002A757754|nr:hypothetical protein [Pseudomonas sp. HR96]WPO98632.1 hypothetical protein SFA35_18610 [Pseudomonas sp. HR96]